jgi:hypothetical protein
MRTLKKILIFYFSISTSLLSAQGFDSETTVGDLIDLKYAFDDAHILSYHPLPGDLSVVNILDLKEDKMNFILLGADGLHLDSLYLNNSSITDFYPISEHIFFISCKAKFYKIDFSDEKLKILQTEEAEKGEIAFANASVKVGYTTKISAKRRVLKIHVQFPNSEQELEYYFKDILSKSAFPISLQWPDRKYYADNKFYLPMCLSNTIVEIDFQKETINEIHLPQSFVGKPKYILYDYLLKKWLVVEMISHYKSKLYEFDMSTQECYLLKEINYYPSWINGSTIYFRDFVNHKYAISAKKLRFYYLQE